MWSLVEKTHPQWHDILFCAIEKMSKNYLSELSNQDGWLPGSDKLFAAFTMPLSQTKYILLGESPYPRAQSANGFAFWDAAVHSLWSETGLSKPVNRATSFRNFLKMLLLARGGLKHDFSQPAIAAIEKQAFIQTSSDFFQKMLQKGFLLLNASLVYRDGQVNYHAKHWRPFMFELLRQLAILKSQEIKLILFGKIAQAIPETTLEAGLVSEHPYNVSFITNPEVIKFFKPFDLLANHDNTNLY